MSLVGPDPLQFEAITVLFEGCSVRESELPLRRKQQRNDKVTTRDLFARCARWELVCKPATPSVKLDVETSTANQVLRRLRGKGQTLRTACSIASLPSCSRPLGNTAFIKASVSRPTSPPPQLPPLMASVHKVAGLPSTTITPSSIRRHSEHRLAVDGLEAVISADQDGATGEAPRTANGKVTSWTMRMMVPGA